MAGISPELLSRSRDLLLECEEFDSNDKLKAVIRAHAPLKTWVNSLPLPQENANSARVDAVISYLHDKSRSDTQEPTFRRLTQDSK